MAETEVIQESETLDPKLESEARAMGWVPEGEWRGKKEAWSDAATFVERGHTVLPIVNAENAKLRRQLDAARGETAKLAKLVEASQEAIAALEEVHTKETQRQVEKARKDLIAEIKDAKKDGDVDREVDAQAELTRLDAAREAAEDPPKKPRKDEPADRQIELPPAVAAWVNANPWFGPEGKEGVDTRKTLLAQAIAMEIRADDPKRTLTDKQFYDKVDEELERRVGGGGREDKVAGTSNGGRKSSGKTFADLPADAKAACLADKDRLVGDGRAHKTLKSWQDKYAEIYFKEY